MEAGFEELDEGEGSSETQALMHQIVVNDAADEDGASDTTGGSSSSDDDDDAQEDDGSVDFWDMETAQDLIRYISQPALVAAASETDNGDQDEEDDAENLFVDLRCLPDFTFTLHEMERLRAALRDNHNKLWRCTTISLSATQILASCTRSNNNSIINNNSQLNQQSKKERDLIQNDLEWILSSSPCLQTLKIYGDRCSGDTSNDNNYMRVLEGFWNSFARNNQNQDAGGGDSITKSVCFYYCQLPHHKLEEKKKADLSNDDGHTSMENYHCLDWLTFHRCTASFVHHVLTTMMPRTTPPQPLPLSSISSRNKHHALKTVTIDLRKIPELIEPLDKSKPNSNAMMRMLSQALSCLLQSTPTLEILDLRGDGVGLASTLANLEDYRRDHSYSSSSLRKLELSRHVWFDTNNNNTTKPCPPIEIDALIRNCPSLQSLELSHILQNDADWLLLCCAMMMMSTTPESSTVTTAAPGVTSLSVRGSSFRGGATFGCALRELFQTTRTLQNLNLQGIDLSAVPDLEETMAANRTVTNISLWDLNQCEAQLCSAFKGLGLSGVLQQLSVKVRSWDESSASALLRCAASNEGLKKLVVGYVRKGGHAHRAAVDLIGGDCRSAVEDLTIVLHPLQIPLQSSTYAEYFSALRTSRNLKALRIHGNLRGDVLQEIFESLPVHLPVVQSLEVLHFGPSYVGLRLDLGASWCADMAKAVESSKLLREISFGPGGEHLFQKEPTARRLIDIFSKRNEFKCAVQQLATETAISLVPLMLNSFGGDLSAMFLGLQEVSPLLPWTVRSNCMASV